MPNMADITVKKADNVTNVVYVKHSPSAGDKTPAVWKQNALSTIPMHRPVFTFMTKDNGPKTARQFTATLKYPIVSIENSVPVLKAITPITATGTLPMNVSALDVKEAAYQFGNLMVDALIRASLDEGSSPS